jgi:hypothetical protein
MAFHIFTLGQAVDAEECLFDFENKKDISGQGLKIWSPEKVKISLTKEWATRGTSALRVEAEKYVKGKMAPQYYPGISWTKGKIPVRDWRSYHCLTFDVKSFQDNTPFSILIQRGGSRLDRTSAFFTLPKGEFRLWIDIPKKIAGDSKGLMNIKQIVALEFHMTRVPQHSIVLVDNICLRDRFDSKSESNRRKINFEQIMEKLSKYPKTSSQNSPMLYMENLSPSISANLQEKIKLLRSLKKKVNNQIADIERTQLILDKHPNYKYSVMVAPPEDQVFFAHQAVKQYWTNAINMNMLKGEIRSKQLIIFPIPDKKLENITVQISDLTNKITGEKIDKANAKFEMIAYVKLPGSASTKNFEVGWYPDPIIKLKQPFSITSPRQLQSLLFTIKAPDNTTPGIYNGTISISPKGLKAFLLPVKINVSQLNIPESPFMQQLVGLGSPQGYKDPDFWLALRINPHYSGMGNIYQNNRKKPMPIELIKQNCKKGMNRFNLLRINKFTIDNCDTDKKIQNYLNSIFRIYSDEYMQKLQEEGLADKAVFYGFDEYTIDGNGCEEKRHKLKTIFSALKKKYGKYGVKLATTAQTWSSPGNLDLPVDIWIPGVGVHHNRAKKKLAEKRGIEVWWYTIRWEIEYHLAFSRAIPWATFGNDAQGWLYYNLNGAWSKADQKLESNNPLTSWFPSTCSSFGFYGTGSLVYANNKGEMVPSLRLINFREGLYDYDLLCLLRKQVKRLEPYLSKLTFEEQVLFERAKELTIDKPWKYLFDDYVSSYQSKKLETQVISKISSMRKQCVELLEKLSKIKE